MIWIRFQLLVLLALCLLVFVSCSRPEERPAVLIEAESAFSRGSYLESEKLYERYLQAYPEGEHRFESWNRLLAVSRFIRRSPLRSVELLEAMHLEFGDDREHSKTILFELAAEHTRHRQFEKAASVYERILQLEGLGNTDEFIARKELFRISRGLGDFEAARAILGPALDLDLSALQRAEVLYDMANLALYQQEDQVAEEYLQTILGMPEAAESEVVVLATYALADLFERSGRVDQARALFLSIRKSHPNPPVVESRLKHLPELSREENSSEKP
ncbi:MAG: tetratricopeptide repeat protein [Desulfovibrionales bacterium]